MRFEWDEAKSETNLDERGFDFAFASLIFDGLTVEVEDRRRDYGEHRVVPEGDSLKRFAKPKESIPPSPGHEHEWIDSIQSRKQPSCHVGYHYKIDAAIALANIAFKLGRSVRFDPATEKIVGDDEAARMARPQYREPWRFPEQYCSSH